MKQSLLLIAMCLASAGAYAQDDDVYFVPSSADKSEASSTHDTYTSGRSSYTPLTDDDTFSQDNWAEGRGTCGRDVDEYNRRGSRYKASLPDTLDARGLYDKGYDDGYEDGACTARIVRFWSPRAGVYVSSPYYLDYFDLIDYDPLYFGYGSPWSWGWSGWYGWGSWYGWRPYYASWGWSWGWHYGWYDPWYWHGPGWGHGWGHGDWAWHSPHHFLPANAQRGPVGGWTARGGSRGAGMASHPTATGTRSAFGSRGNSQFGLRTQGNRSASGRTNFFNGRNGQGTVTQSQRNAGQNSGNGRGGALRNFFNRQGSSQSAPSRSTQQAPSRSSQRSYGAPSSQGSSWGGGGSFGGGGRGGFGGGHSSGGRGGGRGR